MNIAKPGASWAPRQRVLVQLLPQGTGGVRDYVECLQGQWCEMGLSNHVISLSEQGAREQPLVARLKDLLQTERRPVSLLLHFSGYGFHKRGLAFWLSREIDRARRELGDDLQVVTMFHELFASGPPWCSAFWLSGLQASIARRIARDSDSIFTNAGLYANWLRSQVPAAVLIDLCPVFSTIGEPASVRAAGEREMHLVVFGSESTRHRALDRMPRQAHLLRAAGITEVVEVGSGRAYRWTDTTLTHRFIGRLDSLALSRLLEQSAFGLIDYPPTHLGKSTVFAAYAVHGCVALNTAVPAGAFDGLQATKHYLALETTEWSAVDVHARQHISDAGRRWYADHPLGIQAHRFAVSGGAVEAADLRENR